MKPIQYSNLSIQVDKQQLDHLIKGVLSENYSIFWGFEKGKMILNIYSAEANHKLILIKHKQFLELIEVDLKTEKMLNVLDQWISLSAEINKIRLEETKRKQQEIYQRIDQYLIKLNEYLKNGEQKKVEQIKAKLTELNNELAKLKQHDKQ